MPTSGEHEPRPVMNVVAAALRWRLVVLVLFLAGLIWCAAIASWLQSCTATPAATGCPAWPAAIAAAPRGPIEQLPQRVGRAALAALIERADDQAPARIASWPVVGGWVPGIEWIYASSSCAPASGVNPFLWPQRTTPRAGELVRVDVTTRAAPPWPADLVWLVVGFSPAAPVDLAGEGMPGCWLLVRPDYVVPVPADIEARGIVNRVAGDGLVQVAWTPPASMAGRSIWLQAFVAAPGENRAGVLSTHGLKLTIGAAR